MIESLTLLFHEHFKTPPTQVSLLPKAGSNRTFVRMTAEELSVIGVYNENVRENENYFHFSSVFEEFKLPVPKLLAKSQDKKAYLLEDLGTQSLFDLLKTEGHSKSIFNYFKKAIDHLVRFQWIAGEEIDYSVCVPSSSFDENQIFSDLLYFKYYFADLLDIDYDKGKVLGEMSAWSARLAAIQPKCFMYRDLQSRNLMVKDDQVSFIDFQGGMKGLPHYDLASLLWQARASLPAEWKSELLDYYFVAVQNLETKPELSKAAFKKEYVEIVLLRILQTLGAYGFRGLFERKEHFLKSIHPALKQLQAFLKNEAATIPYPELSKLLFMITREDIISKFSEIKQATESDGRLQVKITSFSYKKGLPEDDTTHGGGFVFDCRALHNPGRYERYKELTGKDPEVVEFLEQNTEMPQFIQRIAALVDSSIDVYLERNFEYISISFGCTGGQHRSVYAAEKLAEHLLDKYKISAEVTHREQPQLK